MTSSNDTQLHIFGIRHHGPGSARSLRAALEDLQPDIILVEGPPDAGEMLALVPHEQMQPPVALLIYAPDQPKHGVYYPFAIFSPEWQAIHYGLNQNIPVRFMDLPQAHQMEPDTALAPEPSDANPTDANPTGANPTDANPTGETEPPNTGTPDAVTPETPPGDRDKESTTAFAIRRDPLRWIAEAAGYSDSERWWEDMVEHRRSGGTNASGTTDAEIFAAILEAMTALREEVERSLNGKAGGSKGSVAQLDAQFDLREAQREAWMRQTIRQAQKEGYQRLAVVCGAWHAPALAGTTPTGTTPTGTTPTGAAAKDDARTLQKLPKAKVKATWVPWTYGRLSQNSGYGAGIESPGWYHHLWTVQDEPIVRWLARVAALLREQDLDASSAHVIEAVRLAEALAALRGRPLPGLPEINEAIQAILCFGGDAPLRLIREKLIVGETLGQIPEETPMVPLQQDLLREQKRLRLPPEATQKVLDFDLRKPTDLERSHLLHRLGLLGVPWGQIERASGGKGTFHEFWRTQWQPEFSLQIIEASHWGNTVVESATARARDLADHAPGLPALTMLLDRVLLASLPTAAEHVMRRLQNEAALAGDVRHLMEALPALVNVLRYGNVRQTQTAMVSHIVDGLIARICIGLPLACSSLNDEAAAEIVTNVNNTQSAIALLQDAEYTTQWQNTLSKLAGNDKLHGLLLGRCCRILLDTDAMESAEATRRMSLALSTANDPAHAAFWVEGFLQGSGMLLLHDDELWQVLDRWVAGLSSEAFPQLLPLLRRTFSTFAAAERRQMGERVRNLAPGAGGGTLATEAGGQFDRERANAVLPLVARLLGLTTANREGQVKA